MSQKKATGERRIALPNEPVDMPMPSPQELVAMVLHLRAELNGVHTWLQILGAELEEIHPGLLAKISQSAQEYAENLSKARDEQAEEAQKPQVWRPN